MFQKSENRRKSRRRNGRATAFLALAVAAMAIAGFGVLGTFALGSSVARKVTSTLGEVISTAPRSEKVPASLAARMDDFGSAVSGKTTASTTSTNWGGYADLAKDGTILEVLGEWAVPKIKCTVYPSLASQWVGIDGFTTTTTVEQAGTYEYCPTSGSPSYWDWFEFDPYEATQSVFTVSPGDFFQVYVLYNPNTCEGGVCGVYTIVVEDLSNAADSFLVQGNPSVCDSYGCETGLDGSAECISESLVNQGDLLADYGTETFYSCDASINGYWSGIGGFPSGAHATTYKITCYGYVSGLEQQVPSGLTTYNYQDDHFTIKWKVDE